MCLQVKDLQNVKIATKNIKVWKIFEFRQNKNKLISPFQYCTYKLGEKYHLNHDIEITQGFVYEGFHAYSSKKDTSLYGFWDGYTVLVPCIIPKGSQCVKGIFDSFKGPANCIVSNILILPKTFTYKGFRYSSDENGDTIKTKIKNNEITNSI